MGDIQNRPFSKNYSGLTNQSVIAVGLSVLCITSHEIMKRRRRGQHRHESLGSVESWKFGYLYQGRSWARNPSPPTPKGWPLSWVKECINFPVFKLNELRGIDAALYVRFLRGCFYFILLHTFTTLPILFPIHLHFSSGTVSPRSMTRASIASLVLTSEGSSLLWIHICLLFWLTLTWMGNLAYICNSAFKLRAAKIEAAARHAESDAMAEKDAQYHPHPHPQYPFQDIPSLDSDHSNRGLRLRTVMVSNIPPQLRSEKELKEYFEYYMSRNIDRPSVGLSDSTQPGFANKLFAWFFNRAKRLPQQLPNTISLVQQRDTSSSPDRRDDSPPQEPSNVNTDDIPVIDRIVIARKMTELASLLERREDILRRLETAHIKLAKKTLLAAFRMSESRQGAQQDSSHDSSPHDSKKVSKSIDLERGQPGHENATDSKDTTDLLIQTLSPFVAEFDVANASMSSAKKSVLKLGRVVHRLKRSSVHDSAHDLTLSPPPPAPRKASNDKTIWDALLSLPRSSLDSYQPLIHLSVLFRGKTVPSIDYYTAKLNLLTSLITQNRARAIQDYDPVSTAFVTFADPKDARRACKYLAVHPSNPLACVVTMAPQYEDVDWIRVMKTTFRAEFVKDWVVSLGVWGFTVFWIFPVSLLVGLVSIQNISTFWPGLKAYLDHHPWEEEIIQSFVPTLLVSLLALLIPLILLLLAKKAHTITTLSALHDRIMTRYYKFLIVNVLVFFCVGTAALQSFLSSFKAVSGNNVLQVVADSFPTAGPFYVGWLIFTTALHASFEISLCEYKQFLPLPLMLYPSTKRQVTPRKRAVGIRPRTFNYYYWLPNHLLVIHVLLLFAILNPLVIPFGLLYFSVEAIVIKNQMLHVYAKNYEGNGQLLLIRMVRYSLDGLILSQVVFLAYMVVLKKTVNVALSAVLIVFTAAFKIWLTRLCRAQYEKDNASEADVICRIGNNVSDGLSEPITDSEFMQNGEFVSSNRPLRGHSSAKFWTWRIPGWVNFSYSTVPKRGRVPQRRQPIPFTPQNQSFSRLSSMDNPRHAARSSPHEQPVGAILKGPLHLSPAQEYPPDVKSPQSTVVQRHAPHPAWDDESHTDLPYDNPYYTRPINNVLWLPRNPFGILDLDDTVDLRRSLTSELGAGHLGTWLGTTGSVGSPVPDSPVVNHGSHLSVPGPTKQYSGAEDIDLPSGIRRRVMTLENEEEVESAMESRPSLFGRRMSSGSGSGRSAIWSTRGPTPSRFNTVDSPPTLNHRSSSDVATQRRPRTSSLLSPFSRNQPPPSAFRNGDPSARPDLHAQAEFARSTLSLGGHANSRGTLAHPSNISTQEAVVNEVIVEEQLVVEERMKYEQAEADETQVAKSHTWMTSWLYSKVH
ncbi:hypothetical protein SERLA73DRAFT_169263 [Serpula lacrymans var. lacrymans S7.3]|uniref:DUF221-domain-containing protein n=2 Tax=Serpula lacrymans var. lacrymans TaxID=341189 RepID=F8Q1R1_SERL3|nr:uncharacterized protein SERLADRAFT_450130 [Serpula lacrymans var. lacrymans S7.9]EGN98239.1 hypothetical protein SERLA73DRAFT_169263 [Serpula lacrymans var. lacrymans S7.3]EGO23812.1 hypothetical protein SERLADRAFT_450130 [Serpula lacrymans var. lacrymans S7.9]